VDAAPRSLSDPRQDDAGLPLTGLKHALRRQWLTSCVLAVLCAVPFAAAAWLLQSPKYTSSAYLRVAAADTPLIFETADSSARYDFKTFKSTQRQLLLTPFVLNNALRQAGIAALVPPGAQASPIEWLQREIKKSIFPATPKSCASRWASPIAPPRSASWRPSSRPTSRK
jgi:hypothetical protein